MNSDRLSSSSSSERQTLAGLTLGYPMREPPSMIDCLIEIHRKMETNHMDSKSRFTVHLLWTFTLLSHQRILNWWKTYEVVNWRSTRVAGTTLRIVNITRLGHQITATRSHRCRACRRTTTPRIWLPQWSLTPFQRHLPCEQSWTMDEVAIMDRITSKD